MTTEKTALAPLERMVARPGKMKSALLQWLGIPVQLTNNEFMAALAAAYSGENASGEVVTDTTALKLSAVWACVRLIATTIATLPLNLYEDTARGRRLATEHPLYQLLKLQPNSEMTAVQFWEAFLASMLLPGNAFAEKHRRGDGTIVALEFLVPSRVTGTRQTDGSILWRYIDPVTGTSRVILEDDMFFVPAFTTNGTVGLSPIAYGSSVMGNAMAAEKASGKLFANGMRIQGVFEFDHVVPKNQRDAFQAALEQYRGAINAGKTPLLEAGIHYKSVTMNAEDAELLASRGYSVEEICRWYGVPPFMVGHGEKANAWPASIEQQMIAFLTYTLRGWLKRVEQGISKSLLKPEERGRFYAEFAIEGLLRGDSQQRSAWYNSLIRLGVLTRNEAREKENLAPLAGGDVATVEANMVALSSYESTPDDPLADPTLGNVQGTALNGAQVVALQAMLQSAADGSLPIDTVRGMIAAAFPLLSAAQISAMLTPLAGFKPTKPEPAVVPGKAPAAPGADASAGGDS